MSSQTDEETRPADIDEPSSELHSVHFACQLDAPFLVTQCGLAAEETEWAEGSTKPKCDECWRDAPCRIYGTWLVN